MWLQATSMLPPPHSQHPVFSVFCGRTWPSSPTGAATVSSLAAFTCLLTARGAQVARGRSLGPFKWTCLAPTSPKEPGHVGQSWLWDDASHQHHLGPRVLANVARTVALVAPKFPGLPLSGWHAHGRDAPCGDSEQAGGRGSEARAEERGWGEGQATALTGSCLRCFLTQNEQEQGIVW